jgi:hypothetical protein
VLFGKRPTPEDDSDLTPEEREAYLHAIERIREDQLRALRDPGPSWREWFYFDAMKWFLGLVYLILDSWIFVGWVTTLGFTPAGEAGLIVSLLGALYLEVLFYRYLWRRPHEQEDGVGPFRPGWRALREWGRWTPEEEMYRAGKLPRAPADGSPNPHEFL